MDSCFLIDSGLKKWLVDEQVDRESKKVMIEKERRVGFKKYKAILRYRDGGLKKRNGQGIKRSND